jgi:hypothetical protein
MNTANELNPLTDKAIKVPAPIGDLKAGDTLIMRPKPAHPVPLTYPYVLAQASEQCPVLLMVYDRARFVREGIKVNSYAVGLVYAKPEASGTIY